jgi:RND family efflux transporter MFP subunit
MSVKFFIRFFFILGAISLVSPALAQKKSGATRVVVDAVRQEPLRQTTPVIGRLVARQAGIVAARTRGAVAELKANVGDRVEKGEIVARLFRDRLEAERELRVARIARARAAITTARAQLNLLGQEMKRLEKLRKSAAFSQARYDDKRQEMVKAKSAVSEAQANVNTALIDLKLANIELRDTEIRAPFSGVVSKRHTEVGSYLNVGQAVITLIDDRNLEIEADVPSDRIYGLTAGKEVTFVINGGPEQPAWVRAVVPEENPLTRTRTVRFTAHFANGHKYLATSQSTTLHLPVGAARTVVSVHKDAVISKKGQPIVFVAKDGTAQLRRIKTGEAVGGRFEVLEGLATGDLVVVRGNERLRANQKVFFKGQKAGSGRKGK